MCSVAKRPSRARIIQRLWITGGQGEAGGGEVEACGGKMALR